MKDLLFSQTYRKEKDIEYARKDGQYHEENHLFADSDYRVRSEHSLYFPLRTHIFNMVVMVDLSIGNAV